MAATRSCEFPYEVYGHEESFPVYSKGGHKITRPENRANPSFRQSRDQHPLNQGRFKPTRGRVSFGDNRIIYPTEEREFAERRHRNAPYFPRNGGNNRRQDSSSKQ